MVDSQRDERQRNQCKKRKLQVGGEHNDQDHGKGHERVAWIHDSRSKAVTHGADIIRGMSHQVTGGGVQKKREGKFLEVCKEIVPQIIFDMPGDDNNQPTAAAVAGDVTRTFDQEGSSAASDWLLSEVDDARKQLGNNTQAFKDYVTGLSNDLEKSGILPSLSIEWLKDNKDSLDTDRDGDVEADEFDVGSKPS